jgi:hypothetical protein
MRQRAVERILLSLDILMGSKGGIFLNMVINLLVP